MKIAVCLIVLLATSPSWAADPAASDPGRLFYTPAERAQLESARARGVTRTTNGTPDVAEAVRYDGLVVRSDGQRIRWVNGKAQLDAASVEGLKPGQIRAGKRIYEPYQILTPTPQAVEKETP